MWRIRMPSIAGESRRLFGAMITLPAPPRGSPPCCCPCRRPGIRGARGRSCAGGGGCGTLCCGPLPCPVRREARGFLTGQTGGPGARAPQVVPAPSQHGCRAARVDARAGPRRADRRQKARPRAGLPRRRVAATRILFRIQMRAGCCTGRTGAGSWRRRPVVRLVLERLRAQSPARSADAGQNRPCRIALHRTFNFAEVRLAWRLNRLSAVRALELLQRV